MTELYLHLRTPHGLVLDQPVRAVVAEDLSGFFGIWPGRADLIAALPAGLLTYRDASGEGFVGLSGGILSLRGEVCRVMARDAQMTRDLDLIAGLLHEAFQLRAERIRSRIEVLDDLEREALRRVAEEVRA